MIIMIITNVSKLHISRIHSSFVLFDLFSIWESVPSSPMVNKGMTILCTLTPLHWSQWIGPRISGWTSCTQSIIREFWNQKWERELDSPGKKLKSHKASALSAGIFESSLNWKAWEENMKQGERDIPRSGRLWNVYFHSVVLSFCKPSLFGHFHYFSN